MSELEDIRNDPWLGANMFSLEFRDDPYPPLKRLRELAPVHRTPLGMWRLTRYDDCLRMLRSVRSGVRTTDGRLPLAADEEQSNAAQFMLQQDPPSHTRLRRLVSKAFTPRAVERWRDRGQAIVDGLLDRAVARGDGRLEVISELALPVPSQVICEMLGVPLEDRERFTQWTADATHNLRGAMIEPELRERVEASSLALAEYFERLIAERRASLTDDLISEMIRAEEEGDRLSTEELMSQSIGLLIAGFETTIGLIGNGVRALIRNPEQLARLRADPALVPSAVEECLRFEGPIVLTLRVVHDDVEFGGEAIPKNSTVAVMLAGANRDPARFPDPDRFDVGREDNAHLAFGGGAHFCLGVHLARMESQVAIGGLVQRFERLELESETVEWSDSLFRVPARLPIRVA